MERSVESILLENEKLKKQLAEQKEQIINQLQRDLFK